jgi:hypothetical protein
MHEPCSCHINTVDLFHIKFPIMLAIGMFRKLQHSEETQALHSNVETQSIRLRHNTRTSSQLRCQIPERWELEGIFLSPFTREMPERQRVLDNLEDCLTLECID